MGLDGGTRLLDRLWRKKKEGKGRLSADKGAGKPSSRASISIDILSKKRDCKSRPDVERDAGGFGGRGGIPVAILEEKKGGKGQLDAGKSASRPNNGGKVLVTAVGKKEKSRSRLVDRKKCWIAGLGTTAADVVNFEDSTVLLFWIFLACLTKIK